MTEKICGLCLQTVNEIFRTVEESTLETLKLNPSISEENVICTKCANYFKVFSNLKPALGSKLRLIGLKNEVDLNPAYETKSYSGSLTDTGIKCNFCSKISERDESLATLGDSKRIKSLVNLLKQHFPELGNS